jgi:DnaK suppressor protein
MSLDIKKLEDELRAEHESVIGALTQSAESAGIVELDQSRVGRLSRMDAMQQQAMAIETRSRVQVRLRKLEAALDRIASGNFGLCCQCHDEITQDRLSADPAAVFCAECASERESA